MHMHQTNGGVPVARVTNPDDAAASGAMTPSRRILGMRVDATSYDAATSLILAWAAEGRSRAVAVATVNNVMEGHDDRSYRDVMNAADLVTPDGMPLVWGLRWLGIRSATRVYGPDLTPVVLDAAERAGVEVGFYGSSPEVLDALVAKVGTDHPALKVVYATSPPFGDVTDEEDAETVRAINASGSRILFVGLGCPKQERWIVQHRGRVDAVMLGVGAAFDFLAGTKRQAPDLVQRVGLEWLFRLATEPRRLWRRYLRHNPRFVVLFTRQLLRGDGKRPSEIGPSGSAPASPELEEI
jgi:N-acetylglucosaminyldiphosphoundecaprenol N-acetyl-beta-D-mannosaminyltransferase